MTTLVSRIGRLGLRGGPVPLVAGSLAATLAARALVTEAQGAFGLLIAALTVAAVARTIEAAVSPFARRLRPMADTLPATAALAALFLAALVWLLEALGRLGSTETTGLSLIFSQTALVALLCLVAGERLDRPGGVARGTARNGFLVMTAAGLAGGAIGLGVSHASGASAGTSLLSALAILLATDVRLAQELRVLWLARSADELSEHGIRVERQEALAGVARAELFVFRRRGVLTRGRPRVREVAAIAPDRRREDILRFAAAAEVGARHPLRSAILDDADFDIGTIPDVKGFEHVPGRGVRAYLQGRQLCLGNLAFLLECGVDPAEIRKLERSGRPFRERGDTVLCLTLGGRGEGVIALSDALRPEAMIAIQEIRDRGARVAVMSGDDPLTVEALGRELGPIEILSRERSRKAGNGERAARRTSRAAVVGAPASDDLAGAVSIGWPPGSAFSKGGGDDPPARTAAPAVSLEDRDLRSVSRLFVTALRTRRRVRRTTAVIASLHVLAWAVLAGALVPLSAATRPFLAAALFLAARGGSWALAHRRARGGKTGGGAGSRDLRLRPGSFGR